MANMAYCRFINTLNDLRDCYEHIEDKLGNKAEILSRKKLIALCKDIAIDFNVEDDI